MSITEFSSKDPLDHDPQEREEDALESKPGTSHVMRIILKPLGLILLVVVPIVALIAVTMRLSSVTTAAAASTISSPVGELVPPTPSPAPKVKPLREATIEADLEARKVDHYTPDIPERDTFRNFQGKNAEVKASGADFYRHGFRHAVKKGWFSYEMQVDPKVENELVLTYWGSDGGSRTFDIYADTEKIASEKLTGKYPDRFYDVTYAIPKSVTQGKDKIRIRLVATSEIAGAIWDCWTVRK